MPRQRVLVREIYLRTEKTICTYGRSIIPCTALASDTLSWLKHLGEKSLGDCLNRYTVWRRQDLQMSLLTPENSEYRDATRAHPVTVPNLWARRSKLVVGKHALLVTEVFFPECFDGDGI
jgi:chorismate-pyruvate lyase